MSPKPLCCMKAIYQDAGTATVGRGLEAMKAGDSRCGVSIAFICVRPKILARIGTQCHMGIAFDVKYFTIVVPMHNPEALSHICNGAWMNWHIFNSDNPEVSDG